MNKMDHCQESFSDDKFEVKSGKYKYSIEDAQDTLGRIIGFINNCDTKASVMLGILGVILTIIITDSSLPKLYLIIKAAVASGSLLSWIFLTLLCISAIAILIGILFIMSVLVAKTGASLRDSKIYFTDIALNGDCNIYKEKVLNQSERDLTEDLITQIYLNSVICDKKFKRYNSGIVLALSGLGLFIVLFITGILRFGIGG